MIIKRCWAYLGMALALYLGSFSVQAIERIEYIVAESVGQSYAVQSVVHQLTLAEWRTGSQPSNTSVASNLIALSNHFGMAEAAPFAVPDWDLQV